MNERLVVYTFNLGDPNEASAGSVNESYFMMPVQATLVYACVSPMTDDGGATLDILDDGTDIVTAIDASDHDVPGEWASVHAGGSNDPVAIAAGSELSLDINAAAVGNRFDIVLWFLTGSDWG